MESHWGEKKKEKRTNNSLFPQELSDSFPNKKTGMTGAAQSQKLQMIPSPFFLCQGFSSICVSLSSKSQILGSNSGHPPKLLLIFQQKTKISGTNLSDVNYWDQTHVIHLNYCLVSHKKWIKWHENHSKPSWEWRKTKRELEKRQLSTRESRK